jgi:hypothetical protein
LKKGSNFQQISIPNPAQEAFTPKDPPRISASRENLFATVEENNVCKVYKKKKNGKECLTEIHFPDEGKITSLALSDSLTLGIGTESGSVLIAKPFPAI